MVLDQHMQYYSIESSFTKVFNEYINVVAVVAVVAVIFAPVLI